jgi:hypothetical protein
MEVFVEPHDPSEPEFPPFPHATLPGYYTNVFSSDIVHIVNRADELAGGVNDAVRLDALRYYYHHGRLFLEQWRPEEKKE